MSIKIENDFEGTPIVDSENKLKTGKMNKKQHGKGIHNVEKIVEKYNGSVEFDVKNQDFIVYVMLYMN